MRGENSVADLVFKPKFPSWGECTMTLTIIHALRLHGCPLLSLSCMLCYGNSLVCILGCNTVVF